MEGNSFRSQMTHGTYGDCVSDHRFHDCNAVPAATTIDLGEYPAGTRVDDLKLVHEALGAGVTVSVGIRYPKGGGTDDAAAFLAAASAASAGARRSDAKPYAVPADAILTATIAGSPATGRIDTVMKGIYRGAM